MISWRVEEMVLAVHPSHPLAGRDVIDIRELDGETFVSYDGELSIRRALDRELALPRCVVHGGSEFDNIENIKRVEIPAGVAILPEPTLSREVEAERCGRSDRRQDPNHPTSTSAIIHRRHHQLGLTATRFLKLLTEEGGAAPCNAPAGRSRSQILKPGRPEPYPLPRHVVPPGVRVRSKVSRCETATERYVGRSMRESSSGAGVDQRMVLAQIRRPRRNTNEHGTYRERGIDR